MSYGSGTYGSAVYGGSGASATHPSILVDIAFATNPAATPAWTDVTAYVQGWSIRRGRQWERDQIQAGVATLTLDNRDRRFDPTYSGGPYYPNVRPMRRVRIRATWGSTTYDLYHGYIEAWPPVYPAVLDSDVTITAVDALSVLATMDLNDDFDQQLSSDRIDDVLYAVGWPGKERDLMDGQQEVPEASLLNANVLSHLQAVAEAENGTFFVSKSGYMAFHDRHRRIKQPLINHVTFGDGGAPEVLYVDVKPSYDLTRVYNDVRVTADGGVQQIATDATSQERYYRRSLSRTGVLVVTDGDAYRMAWYLLTSYKEPRLRIESLTLDAQVDPATLWPHILGRELGDRLTIRKRPVGGGTYWEQVSHLEAIAMTWQAAGNRWGVSWQVSPADTKTYWQLGHSTYGRLGSTTRVAY